MADPHLHKDQLDKGTTRRFQSFYWGEKRTKENNLLQTAPSTSKLFLSIPWVENYSNLSRQAHPFISQDGKTQKERKRRSKYLCPYLHLVWSLGHDHPSFCSRHLGGENWTGDKKVVLYFIARSAPRGAGKAISRKWTSPPQKKNNALSSERGNVYYYLCYASYTGK